MTDRTPPHDIGSEQATLGAAMVAAHALEWLLANLHEADFYRHVHRTVYATMAQLAADGVPVDATTVAAALAHQGQLADLGGASYLHDLVEAVPTASNAGYYGRVVAETARARRLIDAGTRIVQLGYEAAQDPGRALAEARRLLDDLDRDGEQVGLRPDDLLRAVRDQQTARKAGRVASWPVQALQELCGPMLGGNLILLAALTSTGKSSLAIQAAEGNAEARHTLYVTYEMSAADTGRHTLAAVAGCTLDDAGHLLDQPEFEPAQKLHDMLDLTVYHHQPDPARLLHEARGLHARQPLGLVIVDYLQKMPPPVGRRYSTRNEEVAEISRLLKDLAVRLDVPVLACAQLNRGAVGRAPVLADLRDSGSLEQDADQVLFLHRDEAVPGLIHALLRKNRMGPTGQRLLLWAEQRAMFEDLPQEAGR